jgi:hypothetical protein
LAAAALEGCQRNKGSSQLKQILLRASYIIDEPFLKTIFALIGSNGNWIHTLQTSGLTLTDRIAVATRFLNDEEWLKYISRLSARMMESGSIEGLFLTGWTFDGISLLQNYVDNTGDVQTAALIISSLPAPVSMPVEIWIDNYCDLLDSWELFHQRAVFCVEQRRDDTNIPPQLNIRCTFCDKSISVGLKKKRMGRQRV